MKASDIDTGKGNSKATDTFDQESSSRRTGSNWDEKLNYRSQLNSDAMRPIYRVSLSRFHALECSLASNGGFNSWRKDLQNHHYYTVLQTDDKNYQDQQR